MNVVCTKVNPTTTTTIQDMWDRMNNVSRKRPIDEYNRTFPDDSESDRLSSEEEDNASQQDSSDLDILGSSSHHSSSEREEERVQVVTSKSNLFQFRFEFGSKRPPRPSLQQQESSSDEEYENQESHPDYYYDNDLYVPNQEDDEEIDLFDLSNDDEDWKKEGKSQAYTPIHC